MQPLYIFGKMCVLPFVQLLMPTITLGKKRKNKLKPCILTCNHVHGFDCISVGIGHPWQVRFIGKIEFFESKFMSWVLNNTGVIGIDRGKPDIGAIKRIMKTLSEKKTIGVFPEGTRNKKDLRIQAFNSGASMFAIKSKVPIVPMAIWRRAKIFRRNYVVVGDPFELTEFYDDRINSEILAQADQIVRQKMIEVKRVLDYFVILRGKERKILKKKLKNPQIPFKQIYEEYLPKLWPLEYSVELEEMAEINELSIDNSELNRNKGAISSNKAVD